MFYGQMPFLTATLATLKPLRVSVIIPQMVASHHWLISQVREPNVGTRGSSLGQSRITIATVISIVKPWIMHYKFKLCSDESAKHEQ